MFKSRWQIALAVASSFLTSEIAPALFAFDASYSFTSSGDGVNWPAHQIARQYYDSNGVPSGLSGDQFDTPDLIAFNNFTGNPAYFDLNNLLTRPAALINNNAWWTDVKTKNYRASDGNFHPITNLHMSSNQHAPTGFTSLFGFDIAVASVAGPVATSLEFIALDNLGYSQQAYIDLEYGDEFTESFGSFLTLNSPHPGFEARVRITSDVMGDIATSDPSYDPLNYGLHAISLVLDNFASPGGTTQIALDNFITGSASPYDLTPEPVVIQNLQPVGANTPTYVTFASEDTESTPTTTYVDLSRLPPDSGVDVSVNFANDNGGPTSYGMSFPSDNLPEDGWSAEATHEPGDRSIEPDASHHLGTITTSVGQSLEDVTVTVETSLSTSPMSAVAIANPTIVTDYAPNPADPDTMAHELVHVVQQGANRRGGPETSFGDHYANYTYQQYLALVGTPIVGDSGYILVPLFDDFDVLTGYDLDAWVVGLNSGSISLYYISSAVPEPTTLMALSALGMLAARRRR